MSLRWIQLTFAYLLITACVGVLMRSMAIVPIPVIEYERELLSQESTFI
ncbi:hypothetical protein [Paenibacillus crassostreae]|nr:hypothetical protein [Paenibacillus crassostreae]